MPERAVLMLPVGEGWASKAALISSMEKCPIFVLSIGLSPPVMIRTDRSWEQKL